LLKLEFTSFAAASVLHVQLPFIYEGQHHEWVPFGSWSKASEINRFVRALLY